VTDTIVKMKNVKNKKREKTPRKNVKNEEKNPMKMFTV
jgi:hypothetical protein